MALQPFSMQWRESIFSFDPKYKVNDFWQNGFETCFSLVQFKEFWFNRKQAATTPHPHPNSISRLQPTVLIPQEECMCPKFHVPIWRIHVKYSGCRGDLQHHTVHSWVRKQKLRMVQVGCKDLDLAQMTCDSHRGVPSFSYTLAVAATVRGKLV